MNNYEANYEVVDLDGSQTVLGAYPTLNEAIDAEAILASCGVNTSIRRVNKDKTKKEKE